MAQESLGEDARMKQFVLVLTAVFLIFPVSGQTFKKSSSGTGVPDSKTMSLSIAQLQSDLYHLAVATDDVATVLLKMDGDLAVLFADVRDLQAEVSRLKREKSRSILLIVAVCAGSILIPTVITLAAGR